MNGEPDCVPVAQCPACDHGNEPMGRLGNRSHYRCRHCGIMYSEEVPQDDPWQDLGGEA